MFLTLTFYNKIIQKIRDYGNNNIIWINIDKTTVRGGGLIYYKYFFLQPIFWKKPITKTYIVCKLSEGFFYFFGLKKYADDSRMLNIVRDTNVLQSFPSPCTYNKLQVTENLK